jgi:hypothetical protein
MTTTSAGTMLNKSVFFGLLVLGVVLLVLGVIESDSVSSSFSRLFTGEPTDKAIWLLIGGGLAAAAGLGGLTLRSRT